MKKQKNKTKRRHEGKKRKPKSDYSNFLWTEFCKIIGSFFSLDLLELDSHFEVFLIRFS